MKFKNLFIYLMGVISLFITVQVEGYNFRSAHRSMNSVEYQRYKNPDKMANFDHKQGMKDKYDSRVDLLDSSIQRNEVSIDNRGLMPHEKNRMKRNIDFNQSGRTLRDRVQNYKTTGVVNSNELAQQADHNWRYQGSIADDSSQISKNFRPKGNNVDLSVVPYKGQFYSRGGKPFSIDPGLLGRWK